MSPLAKTKKQNIRLSYFVDFATIDIATPLQDRFQYCYLPPLTPSLSIKMLYLCRQTVQSVPCTLRHFGLSLVKFASVSGVHTANGAVGKPIIATSIHPGTTINTVASATAVLCPLGHKKEEEEISTTMTLKPFKTMPGPNPLPFIWNIWRYLPFIGEKNFVVDCLEKI